MGAVWFASDDPEGRKGILLDIRRAAEVAGRVNAPAGADTGTADLTRRIRRAPGHSAAGREVDSRFTMEMLAHP